MSYCRFSSDNFRSEIYAYADANGGYTTHVAANRITGEIPDEPSWDEDFDETWAARYREMLEAVRSASRDPIGLPFDGHSFNDPDLSSFLARLESLKAVGYRVPREAIDEVRAELAAPPAAASWSDDL